MIAQSRLTISASSASSSIAVVAAAAAISGSAAVTRAAAESKSIEPVRSFWFFLLNPHIQFLLVGLRCGCFVRRFELRTKIRDRGLVSRDRFVLLLDFLLQLVDAGIYFEQLVQVARFFMKSFSVRADLAFAGRAHNRRHSEIDGSGQRRQRHSYDRINFFSRHCPRVRGKRGKGNGTDVPLRNPSLPRSERLSPQRRSSPRRSDLRQDCQNGISSSVISMRSPGSVCAAWAPFFFASSIRKLLETISKLRCFSPSFSHSRDWIRPSTKISAPFFRYCCAISACFPHTMIRCHSVRFCFSPFLFLYVSSVAIEKFATA